MLNRAELAQSLRRFLTVGKVVLLAGILVATFCFSAIVGMRLAVRGKVIGVPELVGMSVDDARQRTGRVGLGIVVRGERYDSEMPAGTILSQAPGAGVGLKIDRDVQVVVSLGRRIHPVPDLRGGSLRAARLMAEQNGYEVAHVSFVALSDGEEEQVVAQHPEPEASESGGDQIDLLVNRPRESRFVMPLLVGQNINRVLALLEANGFRVGRIQYQPVQSARRGTVLRQFPETGYVLKEGDVVHLEVAR